MKEKIPYDTKVPVTLTLAERDFLLEHTLCDPHFADLAEVNEKNIVLRMDLDHVENLQGYVAAEANHCDDRGLQEKLDRVFDKLQKILDKYDDQDEPIA